jgi:steroid 5-alpha reductase family enzyme
MQLLNLTKKQTLWVFLAVYFFAALVGGLIMLYGLNQNYNMILVTLISTVSMTLVVFIFSNVVKNASLYDPYWSVIPIIIVLEWIFIYKNFSLNVILLLVAILVWGMRLTYNWWKNWDGFKHQDWRYTKLHDQAPKIYFLTNLMGIHMIPTLVVYLQLINAHDVILNNTFNLIFLIGLLISLSAAVIQFIADKQMYDFRMNPNKDKKVIDSGLWKYSRHPNYLGELMFWSGIYLMYFSDKKVIDFHLIYPITMIMLFLFISIPLMEKKLANREGYTEYRKIVSMLLPYRKKGN